MSRLFRLHGGDLVDSVDAVDLHDYSGSLATLGDKLETVRRTLRRPLPIWITETSVPGDPRANAAWDAERQAGALVRHLAAALSTGVVPRIFWHTLGDSPPNPGRREWRAFGTNALYDCFQPLRNAQGHQVCQDRRRKPVGEVFARLNELLRDYTRVEAWDARTVVFRRDGQPPWVAAWRDRGTQPVDLRRWFGDGRVRVQLATAGLPETLEDAGSVPVGMVPVLVTR